MVCAQQRDTDVSMQYGDGNEALRRINLFVEQAAMVYVTGRSGAGKSSLLRLVALIERHSRGQIIVNGQNQKIEMKLSQLPHRVLSGLLKVERWKLEMEFTGYSQEEYDQFLARFDQAFRRGGG